MSDAELFALQLLKSAIESKKVSSDFKIFMWEDNPFLAYQYAREIAKAMNLSLVYVDSFDEVVETMSNAFNFVDLSDSLKVYVCDEFECDQSIDLTKIENVLVICHKVSLDSSFVYKFPKLEAWQVQAYMQTQCPGLNKHEIEWLYNITTSLNKNNENIYRLDNEVKKIGCFTKEQQEQIFRELSESGGYSDLSPLTIFNFTNAIMKKDKATIKNVLEDIDSIDVEGVGLVTILHKNFKQVIDIQMGKNVSPESLGLSIKQFKAIEYNCGKYTSQDLVRIFKFLTGIDYQLKSGLLDLSNTRLIDYIVCSVMS